MDAAYQGGEFSEGDLFAEVKEAAIRERINSLVQFKDLIDEIVEEKRIYGFFHDDEDITQVKENLIVKWPEVEKIMGKSEKLELP